MEQDHVKKHSMKLLLKQIYALHTEIVQELENKLNQQCFSSKACKECDKLRKNLAECRGSYYEALQQQKQQIDVLDRRLSSVKSLETPAESKSVAIQVTTEDFLDLKKLVGLDSDSRPRKRASMVAPIRTISKKACVETMSDASSTLLKENMGKTIRIDFFPPDKNRCSPETDRHQIVLVPESPQSDCSREKMELEISDEMRIMSSHKKVTKWLSDMEVPETVPLTDEQFSPPVSTKLKNTSSVLSLTSGSNSVCNNNNNALPENRRNDCISAQDINSNKEPQVQSENFQGEIDMSLENDAKAALPGQRAETPRSPFLIIHGVKSGSTTGKPKIDGKWLRGRSKKKVFHQEKLKFIKISDTKDSAKEGECTLSAAENTNVLKLDDSDTAMLVGVNDASPVRQSLEMINPENKENVGTGKYLESNNRSEASEDLLTELITNTENNTRLQDIQTPENAGVDLCNTFDRVPCKEAKVAYKVKEAPVRGKSSRMKMPGHECENCFKYYENLELPLEERQERLQYCSKHRANNNIPTTPEHYWEIGFPDTPECQERGYMNETQKVQLRPRRRRPLK